MTIEQSKWNRVPRSGIACIVGMEMISAVVGRKQSGRVAGIAHNVVEIYNSVKCTAGAYPVVDLLAHYFLLRGLEAIRRNL